LESPKATLKIQGGFKCFYIFELMDTHRLPIANRWGLHGDPNSSLYVLISDRGVCELSDASPREHNVHELVVHEAGVVDFARLLRRHGAAYFSGCLLDLILHRGVQKLPKSAYIHVHGS